MEGEYRLNIQNVFLRFIAVVVVMVGFLVFSLVLVPFALTKAIILYFLNFGVEALKIISDNFGERK